MGLYSADMLAEVKLGSGGKVYFGFELDLPDGTTTLKYADNGFGPYKPGLTQWSSIPKTCSIWDPNLGTFTTSVTIVDHDRTLSKYLGGQYEGLMEGQAARVKLVSPNVASGDWFTAFSGKILKWAASGPIPVINLTLGLDDKPLQSGARLGKITNDLFVSAGSAVLDLPIPAVYGIQANANGGAVNCYRISATEWLVSAGYLEEVTEVYEDGYVTSGSWSEQQSERRGRNFTEIAFTANPGDDVAITCDCKGLTAAGAGTGSAIVNEADILEHALLNWYFNKYETGSYETSHAAINSTYFGLVADWFDDYSWTGKKIVTEDVTGYQLINDFAASKRMVSVFWTSAGALGMAEDEFYTWGDAQDVLYQSRLLSESTTENIDDGLVDEVVMRHGYYDADGSTTDESRAMDVSRSYDVAKEIDNAWNVD